MMIHIILTLLCSVATAAEPIDPAQFRTQCAELANASAGGVVAGKDGWLYLAGELRHVASGPFWGAHASSTKADPLDAIAEYRAALARLGIALWVMPVPPKAAVHPEPLVGAPLAEVLPRLDGAQGDFFAALTAREVVVIDLLPTFLAARRGRPLYCRQDSHWSPHGCSEAALALVERIRAQPWYADFPKRAYASEPIGITIRGDLAGDGVPREALTVTRVRGADGAAVVADPASPVILLGDSHCLVFSTGGDMLADGAGLPEQLAAGLGFPIDVVAARGSAAGPARVNLFKRGASTPGYWEGKRLVIWCFASRELSQNTSWPVLPVRKEQ